MTIPIEHTLEKKFVKGKSNGTQGQKPKVCLKLYSCYPKSTLSRHKLICWVWYKGNTTSVSVNNQRKRVLGLKWLSIWWQTETFSTQEVSVDFVLDLLGSFTGNPSREDLEADPSWVELKHAGRAAGDANGSVDGQCQSPTPSVWCSPQMSRYKPNCLSQPLAQSFLTSALSHAVYVNPKAKKEDAFRLCLC